MKKKREAALKCIKRLKSGDGIYVDNEDGITIISSESKPETDDCFIINEKESSCESVDFSNEDTEKESLECEVNINKTSKLKKDILNISKIVMKSCYIESAALAIRARNEDASSGLSLLHWHFKRNFEYFNQLIQAAYWADKVLVNGDNQLKTFIYLAEALFPTKEFIIDISTSEIRKDVLAKLLPLNVSVMQDTDTQDILSPLHSIMVPNPVVQQHGAFINTGSYIKKMCWAPLNSELHHNQFLAVTVYKELADRLNLCESSDKSSQILQIYNCGQLQMGTLQANPAKLEMVLTHNWGKVTDMYWSPQPLPAVCRQSQKLIGHLAVSCSDGFIRIIPIPKQRKLGSLVTVDKDQPILCLGSFRVKDNYPIFPTTMHWRPEFPDRIVAGYNTGHVAIFVLESSVFRSMSRIIGVDIYLKPSIFQSVFEGPCRSVQLCPYDWRVVSCASITAPNAVIVNFNQNPENCVPYQMETKTKIGSQVIWPVPGDLIIHVIYKQLSNEPGLFLHPAQYPAKKLRKLLLLDIGSIDMFPGLNSALVGTRNGQLHIVSLNSDHVNKILKNRSKSIKSSREKEFKSKFYLQYCLKPIQAPDETSPSSLKQEQSTNINGICNCPPILQCVHKLISKFSISLNKNANNDSCNWQMESLLNVHQIAANPNPESSTWVAAALECGLIHIVPLTHLYQPSLDEMATGSHCSELEIASKKLRDEILFQRTIEYTTNHGRPRKYPEGVKYSQIYKEMGKKFESKKKPKKVNNQSSVDIEESRNARRESLVRNLSPKSKKIKSTCITDYFGQRGNSINPTNCTTSTPLKNKPLIKKQSIKKKTSINSIENSSKRSPKKNTRKSSIVEVSPIRQRLRSFDLNKSDSLPLSPVPGPSKDTVHKSLKSPRGRKRKLSTESNDSVGEPIVKTRSNARMSLDDSSVDQSVITRSKTASRSFDQSKSIVTCQPSSSNVTTISAKKKDDTATKVSLKKTAKKEVINKVKTVKKSKKSEKIVDSASILKYMKRKKSVEKETSHQLKESIEKKSKRKNISEKSVEKKIETRKSQSRKENIIDISMIEPVALETQENLTNSEVSVDLNQNSESNLIRDNNNESPNRRFLATDIDDDNFNTEDNVPVIHSVCSLTKVKVPLKKKSLENLAQMTPLLQSTPKPSVVSRKNLSIDSSVTCDNKTKKKPTRSKSSTQKINKEIDNNKEETCKISTVNDLKEWQKIFDQRVPIVVLTNESIIPPVKEKEKPSQVLVNKSPVIISEKPHIEKESRKIVIDNSRNKKVVKVPAPKKSKNSVINDAKLKKLQDIVSMKRRELLEDQNIRSDTLAVSTSARKAAKMNWWGSCNPLDKEENEMDINRIDDISLGNCMASLKRKTTSGGTVENQMDKIQKVINRGLSQSNAHTGADHSNSPLLLQPFRSLKISKSLGCLNGP